MPEPLLPHRTAVLLSRLAPDLDPLEVVEALRRELGPEEAREAARLHHLRRRARGKLPHPERLLLSEKGVEQASDHRVAAHRASRFAAWDPGAWILDATAGIGGDSLALLAAGRERLVAADLDARTTRMLRENLAAAGGPARVVRAAAESCAVRADGLLLDPDRRAGTRRDRGGAPERWSPPWSTCVELIRRFRAACVKLPPAVEVERLASLLAADLPHEWQWVSLARELKEVSLWTGELADGAPEDRGVAALDRSGRAHVWRARPVSVAPLDPAAARAVRWIAEPDPAVIRAGLVGALAAAEGFRPLAAEIAYLGGEGPPRSPLLDGYLVLDHAPLDPRRVRAVLGRHGVGPLTVKKRGHPEDAATLARRLRGRGKDRGLLIVTRLPDGHHAFLVQRSS